MIEPTYISTLVVEQKKANFPQITFCPAAEAGQENGYKTDVLEGYGVTNYELQWVSNDSRISEQKLFDLATYDFWDLIQKVYVRHFLVDPQGRTSFTVNQETIRKEDITLIEQRHRTSGKCHTWAFGSSVRKYGLYYMKIFL